MRPRTLRNGRDVTSEYNCWAGIRYRCNNPNSRIFKYYGGRGISVCEEWDSFDQFLKDMGPKPTPNHSIDRVNNSGDYHPDNCRWATKKEQSCNRRDNVIIDGITQKAHAEKIGLTPTGIRCRRKNGVDVFSEKYSSGSGENQWMALYSNDQVREMRRIAAEKGWSKTLCLELSKVFGGTSDLVRNILKGRTYNSVK